MSSAVPIESFLQRVDRSLGDGTFAKLTLGKYRGPEPDLERVTIRPVLIKGEAKFAFASRHRTRDVTKNLARDAALAEVERLIEGGFRSATLFAGNAELQLLFNKRGEGRLHHKTTGITGARPVAHDREKSRLLSSGQPFLHGLGITDRHGRVLPSMSAKWKQINRFLEVFAKDFAAARCEISGPLRVVDFGCGKGYLTFALHDWLTNMCGLDCEVTGIELRSELVAAGNQLAADCGCLGLKFAAGDIARFAASRLDVMIALHACDTATDLALHSGIRKGARLLMCAPCCHKEIRPQLRVPEIMQPVLRHGIHLGAEADMLTDSLRALLLETAGYDVKVFEFISLEHTSKNRMITAVRNERSRRGEAAREELARLKDFYGIREQKLETLLTTSACA